jgi:hypothetical protein
MLKNYFRTALICLLLTGCVTFPIVQPTSSPPPSDSPVDWTRKESGAFIIAGEKVFLGMGVSSGTRNTLLLRSSADNLAQAEVTRILADFTETLVYSVFADSGIETDEIEAEIHTIVSDTAADAVIVDHRQNRDSGHYYALCRLPLAIYKSRLATHSAFDQKIRQAMLVRADEWFDNRAQGY